MIHRSATIMTLAVALVAAPVAPFVMSTYALTIATNVLVSAIFAVSLNLVLGYGGLSSLGHAAFFGSGAYVVALLAQHGAGSFSLGIIAAMITTLLLGVVLGRILLRTHGLYFLMATLAVGEIMRNVAESWRSVTNGGDGLYGIKLPEWLADGRHLYWFLLAALVIVIAAVAVLMRSPFGYSLRAVRDNRNRTSVLGVNPLAVELRAFALSAAIAGFAGAMFAYAKAFVSPDVLSLGVSTDAVLMVVLGGPGTLLGPVGGALVVQVVRGVGSIYTERWLTILGLLACLVALDPLRYVRRRFAQATQPALPATAPGERGVPSPVSVRLTTAAVPEPNAGQIIALEARGVRKQFGSLNVLTDISFSLSAGERRGLIGPNGAGKTTLLNILSGVIRPDGGSVYLGGRDITKLTPFERARLGVGRTFQIANLFDNNTVRENILISLLARAGQSQHVLRAVSAYDSVQDEASRLLTEWSLSEWGDVPVGLLSYGRRRLVEIVLAVSQRPKVILLDEPAAGLSGRETKDIIDTVIALDPQLSLLIVEHDMDLVFSVCDSVTVIANGRVLAEGTGETVRRDKSVNEAYLGMPL